MFKVVRVQEHLGVGVWGHIYPGEDKTWTRGPWTPTLDRVHGRDHFHGPGPWTLFFNNEK